MSTSSRQEAMEGEPVRRHVSDAICAYEKPVYGMFIAVKIDTNTAETFRHGIWYTSDETKQRLDIVPLSLNQFRKYFVDMFKSEDVTPDKLTNLLDYCVLWRDEMDAPNWKKLINDAVMTEKSELLNSEKLTAKEFSQLYLDKRVVSTHPSLDMRGRIIGANEKDEIIVAVDHFENIATNDDFYRDYNSMHPYEYFRDAFEFA